MPDLFDQILSVLTGDSAGDSALDLTSDELNDPEILSRLSKGGINIAELSPGDLEELKARLEAGAISDETSEHSAPQVRFGLSQCPRCWGTGIWYGATCNYCDGRGAW